MAEWLILFVAGIYVLTGVGFLLKGNLGMAIVFIAYAVANLGLYIAGR